MGRVLTGKRAPCLLAAGMLFVAGGLPVLYMLGRSLAAGGRFSLEHYAALLRSGRTGVLLGHSLALAASTAAVAGGLGVFLGLLLGRTDLPLARLFAALFTVPLLLPPSVTAVAWSDLFAPGGALEGIAGRAFVETGSTLLFGLPGCVLLHASAFMPVVMLLTMAYARGVDPRLEEAARLAAPWPAVLRTVTLPLVLPGVLAACLIVFLLSLGEITVPLFFRYDVYAVESFTLFSAFYDFGGATAAAAPLVLLAAPALLAERVLLREGPGALRPAPGSRFALRIPLGPWRRPLGAGAGLLLVLLVVAPLGVLVRTSASLASYQAALAHAGASLARSLAYAAAGATLLLVVGFLFALCMKDGPRPARRALDASAVTLFVLPGTVVGIGLIALWNHPATNFVYGTFAMILLGYLARYTVLAGRITAAAFEQVPGSMEEAARIGGAGPWRSLLGIRLPLVRRGMAAAWLVGYIFCLRETTVSMLVSPPGGDPFSVRLFTLMANGSPGLVAALGTLMAACVLLPLGVLALLFRERR